MEMIIPPARPHRDKARLERVLNAMHWDKVSPVLVFVRGHYLSSMGDKAKNDYNIYDDSCYLIANSFKTFESWNANTDPSFARKGGRRLAKIDLGSYQFYQGKHKSQYNALRAFPEGVKIPCTREGVASTAQYINIHKGSSTKRGASITHSEGCLTIPDTQYGDFISRVYSAMDSAGAKVIRVHVLENRPTSSGQRWFDRGSNPIA
jgi:lysozyme